MSWPGGFGYSYPQQGNLPQQNYQDQQQYYQQDFQSYSQDMSQMDYNNPMYQQQFLQQAQMQQLGQQPAQMPMQSFGYPPQYMDPMMQQQLYQGYQQYGYQMPGFPPMPGQGYPPSQTTIGGQVQSKSLLQESEQFPTLSQQQIITQEALAKQQRQKQLKQQISVQDSLARNTGLGSSESSLSQLKKQQTVGTQQKQYLTKSQKKQQKKAEKERQEKEEQERKQLEEILRRQEEERKKQELLAKKKEAQLKKTQEEAAKKARQEEEARLKEQKEAQTQQSLPNNPKKEEVKQYKKEEAEVLKAINEQFKQSKLAEENKAQQKKQEDQKEEEEEKDEEEEDEDEEEEEDEDEDETSLASDEEYVTDSEDESDQDDEKKKQKEQEIANQKLNVTAQEWVPMNMRHIQKENVNFTVFGVNINEEDRIKIEQTTQDQVLEEAPKKKKKKKKVIRKKPKKPVVVQDVDQLKIVDPDETRKPCNIVFIGHVDVGKSTICGNILFLTGKVDKRTIEKYEIEAKEKGRDSWWLAYVMDTNEEERAKGKTIEVGRAHFETQSKRITILDAPGHEKYVPNMIQGACQADYGALVISARSDEFESGFVGGGQTREHAVLARSLGVEKIIVCINKMDDPSVNWSEDRYIQIKNILEPFLESIGYNIQRDIFWVPCSGLTGTNINEKSESICPWYKGPSFFQIIDELELPQRYEDFVRIPIIDRMKAEVGVNFFGKIESGKLKRNQQVLIYPAGLKCNVSDIYTIYDNEDKRLSYANAGENIRFKLTTANKTIQRGYVLCTPENPVPIVKRFEANMQILDHVEHKPIMSAGYQCILHVHTAMEECVISAMLFEVDIKTKKTKKITFAKDGQYVIVQIEVKHGVCMEVYKTLPYFGRFTLRDQSKTLAIGKVTKIIEGKEPEGESEEEHEEKKEEEEEVEEEEEEEAKEETGNAQDS